MDRGGMGESVNEYGRDGGELNIVQGQSSPSLALAPGEINCDASPRWRRLNGNGLAASLLHSQNSVTVPVFGASGGSLVNFSDPEIAAVPVGIFLCSGSMYSDPAAATSTSSTSDKSRHPIVGCVSR